MTNKKTLAGVVLVAGLTISGGIQLMSNFDTQHKWKYTSGACTMLLTTAIGSGLLYKSGDKEEIKNNKKNYTSK